MKTVMSILTIEEYRKMPDGSRRVVETQSLPASHRRKAARIYREFEASARHSWQIHGVAVSLDGQPVQALVCGGRLEVALGEKI